MTATAVFAWPQSEFKFSVSLQLFFRIVPSVYISCSRMKEAILRPSLHDCLFTWAHNRGSTDPFVCASIRPLEQSSEWKSSL
mmetsp:Transcript_13961/g.27911  ORF Transcript_13961/g.27911 Transcript_13961/m.27911 type:complete len:82 (-) Transcript_13961:346-591(-)